MNFKTWLEATGLTVKEEQYLTPPTMPYVVYSDDADATYKNLVTLKTDHNLTVDLYTAAIDTVSEGLIETLIDAYQPYINGRYTRNRKWVDYENAYVTTYTFTYEEIE